MIDIIGAPLDLSGKRRGTRLGPAAVRLAGLVETLEVLGQRVEDGGDLTFGRERTAPGGLRNFEPVASFLGALRSRTQSSLRAGRIPLLIGGEHTLSIASVAAALEHHGDRLAVLWIDAHADLNTPATSPSGNLHGMPLAVLTGQESGSEGTKEREWLALLGAIVGERRLRPDRVAWLGLRDVDPGEQALVRSFEGCFPATMQDVDRRGLVGTLDRFDAWMRQSGATALWVSFDVDSLDPVLAPGTGTAVRGGLTYREAHLCAELLREKLDGGHYTLAGLDLVETNPLFDTNNQTATTAVEWIASLFGKTILGKC